MSNSMLDTLTDPVNDPVVDPVILAASPKCTEQEACAIAAMFDIHPEVACDLGSERDRTFLLHDSSGAAVAVMKVSNAMEDPATLDMEATAALHACAVDPSLPIALPWAVPGGRGHRARWTDGDNVHWVRMYDAISGHGKRPAIELTDEALVDWGTVTARLGRALRSFIHPAAIRTMPWDVQHTLTCRPMVPSISDPAARALVTRTLDRFESNVFPRWPMLRAQVVHGDFTTDNAIVDDRGRVVGIVDFGDMSHTALLTDVASLLDSLADGRPTDELGRVARLVLDGYQRITPLEPLELDLVGELWAARIAIGIAIASWRTELGLQKSAFGSRYQDSAVELLDGLLTIGWEALAAQLSSSHGSGEPADLIKRRSEAFGPGIEDLSYNEPLHVSHGDGAWIVDVDGRRYLDAYNNVPCIGHAHPRVTEAIARSSRRITTNLRYLHGSAVELAERLTAACPSTLDTVFLVNSGTEANDLAWRLATTFTGNTGGLCTRHAYHGVSSAIAAFSPETLRPEDMPSFVERWHPTDTYRQEHLDESSFAAAVERLARAGVAPAMAILDGVLQSDGVYDLSPALVQQWVAMTHAAGGLWVADEVQGGHGRTGDAMWSFSRFGIEPDVVTLGKPMGNGHPVAAVITRREIAECLAARTVFFSTFGGNQVSVAAAHAVLDVLEDERVLPRVVATGGALRAAMREVAADFDCVGDVRGIGLANAIEIVQSRSTREPDRETALRLKEGLRQHGVLVGTTGPAGNVLKVRPPLAFNESHIPTFATALSRSLADLHTRIDPQ